MEYEPIRQQGPHSRTQQRGPLPFPRSGPRGRGGWESMRDSPVRQAQVQPRGTSSLVAEPGGLAGPQCTLPPPHHALAGEGGALQPLEVCATQDGRVPDALASRQGSWGCTRCCPCSAGTALAWAPPAPPPPPAATDGGASNGGHSSRAVFLGSRG